MLVGDRMAKPPITAAPGDLLSHAVQLMNSGRFRRLPVLSDNKLVGIITERDLREHRQCFMELAHVSRNRRCGVHGCG